MKTFLCKEILDGFDRWFKFCCYATALWFVLDLLPKLPEELAKPIADKIVSVVK